jgi:hypothetical protein
MTTHDQDHAPLAASPASPAAPGAPRTPRDRREERAFETLVNELGSALLRAHDAFLTSLEPPPEGVTRTLSWLPELRTAAALAFADAGRLDPELAAGVVDIAYGECRRGFAGSVAHHARDHEARPALRVIVAERFEGAAKEAMTEASRAAEAALAIEAEEDEARAPRPEELWEDRADVVAVACVDDAGVVWGIWRDAEPPLHMENFGRAEGAPRVRVNLERRGVRAFDVVEGVLEGDALHLLAERMTFRDELEDAWTGELLRRRLLEARYEEDRLILVPYAGTPHAYEVTWSYGELFPEHGGARRISDVAFSHVTVDPPELHVLLGEAGDEDLGYFRLAGLIFADVAPAWIIGWHGPEERARRYRRDEACLRARLEARAANDALLVEAVFGVWEHAHAGEVLVASRYSAERRAMGAELQLEGADRSPALVQKLSAWAGHGLREEQVARLARRRLRAVAPFLDDPKPVIPLPMTENEADAMYYALASLFVDAPSARDADGFRLSVFWLDALAAEWAGLGHAKLYVSVGEFVIPRRSSWNGWSGSPDDGEPWDDDEEPEPPRVIVALPRSWRDPILREAQITLDEEPELRGTLPEPFRSRVIAFVREHRRALLDHWHGHTCTSELAKALEPALRGAESATEVPSVLSERRACPSS